MSHCIQGLWIGDHLSSIEVLSITSYLAHGHDFHLYCYDNIANVPYGTKIFDARAVLPHSALFKERDRDSYAAFSDFFRYKLLLSKGGWWSDLDQVCLRQFDFDSEYVFSSEQLDNGQAHVNCGVIRLPKKSDIAQFLWRTCATKDTSLIIFGEVGPSLMSQAVNQFNLLEHVQEPSVFCPVSPHYLLDLLLPRPVLQLSKKTRGIHLWNQMWTSWALPKDENYAPNSFYELLRSAYTASETEVRKVASNKLRLYLESL